MKKTKKSPKAMATAAWQTAQDEVVARLRPAYLAELARLALSLKAKFEAGELRGFTDEDLDRERNDEAWRAPLWRIEDAAAVFFGLDEKSQGKDFDAALRTAAFIRAVSPGDVYTEDGLPSASQATKAVACDVVAIARARGWYKPTADECPAKKFTRWALEAA